MKTLALARLREQAKPGTKTTFSRKHLQTLDEFQNYGGSGVFKPIGERLFKLDWPPKFRRCSVPLWRVMVLEQTVVDQVLSGQSIKVDNASSWSKSQSIAREFINTDWFYDYVLKLKEPCVLLLGASASKLDCLDIDALHNDAQFKADLDYHEDLGGYFGEGLDLGGSQKEVAVHRFTLTKAMIQDAIPKGGRKWIRKKGS